MLSPARIATAALAYIDEHGLPALSMRKLARVLECEAMAIYHHYPSKGALLDAVVDILVADLRVPGEAEGPWLLRFRGCAELLYGISQTHPQAYPLLAMRRFNTPVAFRFYDDMLALLFGAGMSIHEAALAFRMVAYYTNGAAMARIASFAQESDATPPVLEVGDGPDEYPRIQAVAPHLRAAQVDALFLEGLDRLLSTLPGQ